VVPLGRQRKTGRHRRRQRSGQAVARARGPRRDHVGGGWQPAGRCRPRKTV